MTFNSLEFVIFFPVVTVLYFLLPHRLRWLLLLVASVVFYIAFIPAYIFILAALIVIDYWAGILIERSSDKKQRRLFLILSVISTCLVLFIFKYFNFFNFNLGTLASFLHWNYPIGALSILLPLGLSFHTFQSLAYVIEVYRGRQKAEYNIGIYSLYVMFYPQLVAGPIERPQHLIPQLYQEHRFEYKRVVDGLKRMLWGMFKKVVIADNLAFLVDQIYSNPHGYAGLELIWVTMIFAIQIYADFSGYVDIAIGSAKVMGFDLVENFRNPYLANSILDFWRRWHISLSSWFRDYVYIPLGGNRVLELHWYSNILIVFLLSGLWHGASWTFILWGALHGVYIVFSKTTQGIREKIAQGIGLNYFPKLRSFMQIVTTFSLVSFAWIFFRANSISDAWYIVSHLFAGGWESIPRSLAGNYLVNALVLSLYDTRFVILLSAIFSALYMWRHIQRRGGAYNFFFHSPSIFLRWSTYLTIIWAIFSVGVLSGYRPFIYFAF
ncbi:MAG: putative membrane protein involved in D-alanine export [Parcubacteria group bacterium Gr01-1014_20]|nr:MAG: putative membrane protein involved in D-alanine export [Parcubacteria group bacterium Gr01-1014_20]